MRAQITNISVVLIAVLADTQTQRKYFGRFCVRVFKNGYSLQIGEADNVEENEVGISPFGAGGKVVEVISSWIELLSLIS